MPMKTSYSAIDSQDGQEACVREKQEQQHLPQMQHQPYLHGKGRGGGAFVYQAGISGNAVRAVL